jgi:hypothetical protein
MPIPSEASWHPESAVDSDLAWAKATDYTYFDGRSSQWLPFLVLLREGVTFQAFQENFASLVGAGTVRVAPAFWPEDPGDNLGSSLTLEVLETSLAEVLESGAWKRCIDRLEFSAPNPVPVSNVLYTPDRPEATK